jgi:hypothetical protein
MMNRLFRTMSRAFAVVSILSLLLSTAVTAEDGVEFRRLSVAEYRDRVAAGWTGQMVGVGWGAPTEFRFKGVIIPEDRVPAWKPAMVNQYNQDDIYVEMTFLRSMELYGLDVSIRQAGIDFANSGYRLWHANRYGRENLRNGIAPPDSGHPKFNSHADDIDYQIEADYSGLIAPGMPNVGIELGEKFGRLMNYGDGLYGGQFVAGMYAEAFFENDPQKLIEAGLACIPPKSQFAEAIRDVLKWYAEERDDWQAVWQRIDKKYQLNKDYRRFSCDPGEFNIDAKINAAYIVMGLLYGDGDIEKTTVISMRCGQDSDCNPSNATGILCTTIGLTAIPDRFVSALDRTPKYSHTEYNFDMLVDVCEKLARQAVAQQGGRVDKDSNGSEVFVIPVKPPKPSALEQCWEPGPAANARFTEEEMEQINPPEPTPRRAQAAPNIDISKAVAKFAPDWAVKNCGDAMEPGLRTSFRGKSNVLVTHPKSTEIACSLSRTVDIPAGKRTTLSTVVSHHEQGDWLLSCKVNGERVHDLHPIDGAACTDGWCEVEFDLSNWAGQTVNLELLNRATDWSYEAGYWAKVAIDSQ